MSCIQCLVCMILLDRPVLFACGAVLCTRVCLQVKSICICLCKTPYIMCKQFKWVETSQSDSCPCCHNFHPANVMQPSDFLLGVLGQAMVICPFCMKSVQYSDIKAHCITECSDTNPADLTLQDVLSQPFSGLCYMYNIVHNNMDFESAPVQPRPVSHFTRHSNNHQLQQPCCHTNAFQNSFFP